MNDSPLSQEFVSLTLTVEVDAVDISRKPSGLLCDKRDAHPGAIPEAFWHVDVETPGGWFFPTARLCDQCFKDLQAS